MAIDPLSRPSLSMWLAGRTTFEVVNGWRFTTPAVLRAAGIDGATLTNYLTKTPLELVSKSSGQGRARQFCLIDVYQLALLARFARLTSRVKAVAGDLNWLLWADVVQAAQSKAVGQPGFERLPWEERVQHFGLAPYDEEKTRLLFCEDARHAPALYHHREEATALFLYTDSYGLGLTAGPNPAVHDRVFFGGIIVNGTAVLRSVDVALAEHIQHEEEKRA